MLLQQTSCTFIPARKRRLENRKPTTDDRQAVKAEVFGKIGNCTFTPPRWGTSPR